MPIFLDSSRLEDIEHFMNMGILRGVTTNPTILLRESNINDLADVKKRCTEIAELVDPFPVSVEVTRDGKAATIEQAKEFYQWAQNIVIKVTIHGPEGELENVEAIHELESKHDIRVNVTAMMSAQQCFLAALAGASYVSIFGGRINNMGYNSCVEIQKLRTLLDDFGLKAKIIVGSSREVLNIVEWLEVGAHIVTATPSLIKGMLVHPYSKETVKMFLDDGAKLDLK